MKALTSTFLYLAGLMIIYVHVNPWAALGIFLFVWGNNLAYSLAREKFYGNSPNKT